MGQQGSAGAAGTPTVHDHACLCFDDYDEFLAAGLPFLAAGLDLGQRLLYIADRDRSSMRQDLVPLGDLDAMTAEGRLVVQQLSDVRIMGSKVVPEEMLVAYRALTEQAVADGYTGLRVLAEVTDIALNPEHRPEQTRWEQLANFYMKDHPLAALCAYDRRQLGDGAAAIACVHPQRFGDPRQFAFAVHPDGDRVVVRGEADAFSTAVLTAALHSLPRQELRVDLSGLEFVDARAVTTIRGWQQRRCGEGRPVALVNPSPAVTRVCALVGVDLDR